VESIAYDSEAKVLRINGKNEIEHEFIKKGQYHTLEIVLNRQISIVKDIWDTVHLERINQSLDVTECAEIAAIVMQPGLAQVCLITANMTMVRAKIEITIPKKRIIGSAHEKGVERFFTRILESLMQHINFNKVKVVLVASPGFLKDEFSDWMWAEVVRREFRELIEHRPKFMLLHSATGFKHSLIEVLSDPAIQTRISNTKAFREIQALSDWNATMASDPDRAVYGLGYCRAANNHSAIQYLMITDDLFRHTDAKVRNEYVSLVESVRENKGEVYFLSSLHASGEALSKMTGVAAMLRFPLPDLQVICACLNCKYMYNAHNYDNRLSRN
jgi:protein pelota